MKDKQKSIVRFLLLASLFFVGAICADDKHYNINDFKRSYFKIITLNSGFYKVDNGLEKLKDHQPLLYGYIDKDLYTDIITISKDRKSTKFFFYNDADGIFENTLDGPKFDDDERIVSAKLTVVSSTASYPDVIFITENTSDFSIQMYVYGLEFVPGQGLKLNEIPGFKVNTKNIGNHHQEPINFQVFESKSVKDYWLVNDDGKRKLISFNRETKNVEIKDFADLLDASCDGCLSPEKLKDHTLSTIGTNGFIDLDRDCRADLILESADGSGNKFLEIFLFNSSGKFGLKKIIPLESSFSIGSFIDVNQDNSVDLAFYDKNSKKLMIYYSLLEGNDKLPASTQCLDKGLELSFPSLENKDDKRYLSIQDLIPDAELSENQDLRVFPLLRFADFDLDGFLDMIVNFKINGVNEVYLFKNTACANPPNPVPATSDANPLLIPICRIFIREPNNEKISSLVNKRSIQSSAFDFGERG